ncbi:RCC1/BLIP-II [Mytilinidion resinicola]|uniref:RCC1/BLIP-II n=1 Tax=Mytilinidion resinicola TaxID=574789 RepID=A0A6A6Z052_9PEZI|nr:RCC1/BLIP-II [Mytilinidion resinicola]KAF2814542.1 RCC1/BLIP-II [Mytilinidion resinicola]
MTLYSFGSNGSYQLGLSHNDDISNPTSCAFQKSAEGLDSISVTQIVGGGNHTLIQLSNGLVKAVGENTGSRCGPIPHQTSEKGRNFVVGFQHCLDDVVMCAASWEASAAIVRRDTGYAILTTGTGSRGELGQGLDIVSSDQWKEVLKPTDSWGDSNSRPVDIHGSMNHFVTVLSNGEVYGWGKGRNGQLGEPREDSWKPRKIPVPFRAVHAVCGREFTYILGAPESGEHLVLGPDKSNLVSAAPAIAPRWKQVGATWSSILVLDQSGNLHTWGKRTRITPPESLPRLEQVAIGSEHVLATTTSGKVIAWGWGKHGNCGLPIDGEFGDVQGRYNEIEAHGAIKLLGAGCATSWIGLE